MGTVTRNGVGGKVLPGTLFLSTIWYIIIWMCHLLNVNLVNTNYLFLSPIFSTLCHLQVVFAFL